MMAHFAPIQTELRVVPSRASDTGSPMIERVRAASRLRPGDIFAPPPGSEVAIVEEGCLTLEITMLNGSGLCIQRIKSGDVVVPLDMIATPAFAPSYRADTATRIGWLRLSSPAHHGHADLEHLIARSREKLVGACIRLIHELACLPTPHRFYCELLRLAATQHGVTDPVLPLPSQTELALRLCTTRESISREISFLRREGVLSAGKMPRLRNRGFLIARIANALNLTSDDEVWASIGAPAPGA